MKRLITNSEDVSIDVLDSPGAGGACHEYLVQPMVRENDPPLGAINPFTIKFQKGPIQEVGVNGCQVEDLLNIIIDRLQDFQGGNFPCIENQQALSHCRTSLEWLEYRTDMRRKRGVEGKSTL